MCPPNTKEQNEECTGNYDDGAENLDPPNNPDAQADKELTEAKTTTTNNYDDGSENQDDPTAEEQNKKNNRADNSGNQLERVHGIFDKIEGHNVWKTESMSNW
jgi:hypothetical protein